MCYETQLLTKLRSMPIRKWHKLPETEDHDRLVSTIKCLIDLNEPYEFNNNFTKIRRVQLCD